VDVRNIIAGFFRADVPLSEIEPYRRAGGDAYELYDKAPPASWTGLAAWNAFLLQVYGDNLVSASTSGRYVATDSVVFARRLFQWANVWVEEARKTQASETYRFGFDVPYPLPHWVDELRSDAQLTAMRATLDTGRMHTASGVERFSGEHGRRDRLRVFQAEIDAEAVYVDRLWTGNPTDELRATISFALAEALDHTYELGQLLAQPALFEQLF
jgi:hypothetical protein